MKCPLCDTKVKKLEWQIELESKEGKSVIKICESCAETLGMINKHIHKVYNETMKDKDDTI